MHAFQLQLDPLMCKQTIEGASTMSGRDASCHMIRDQSDFVLGVS